MENILHIYGLAPNAEQPLVCFDEKTYQIIDDIIAPIPMSPGRVKRYSDKYERKGTVQILVAYLPNFEMENILHIYGLAPNAEQPLVCFDEQTICLGES